MAELAARLARPTGTAHRICTQLRCAASLARDMEERSFLADPALHQPAFDALNHGVVRGRGHAGQAERVAQVGETCNSTTFDGAQGLNLDRVEAPWPLRPTPAVGAPVALHGSASGKLFLAQAPGAARDALIAHLALPRMMRNSIVSAKALRADCDHKAGHGTACDREEFNGGLIGVAVAVRGSDASGGREAGAAVKDSSRPTA